MENFPFILLHIAFLYTSTKPSTKLHFPLFWLLASSSLFHPFTFIMCTRVLFPCHSNRVQWNGHIVNTFFSLLLMFFVSKPSIQICMIRKQKVHDMTIWNKREKKQIRSDLKLYLFVVLCHQFHMIRLVRVWFCIIWFPF